MVSCLSYYNSSLNLCWSVSTVLKQKPIIAEAQSSGRVSRVTRPCDWSVDNQEVRRSQSNEGNVFSIACWRVRALDRPTCEYLSKPSFLEDRDFSQWFISSPSCRFDGMREASLPPLNAVEFRAKFSSLRQLWRWRLLSAAGWTVSPSGARKRLGSAPCWSCHVW